MEPFSEQTISNLPQYNTKYTSLQDGFSASVSQPNVNMEIDEDLRKNKDINLPNETYESSESGNDQADESIAYADAESDSGEGSELYSTSTDSVDHFIRTLSNSDSDSSIQVSDLSESSDETDTTSYADHSLLSHQHEMPPTNLNQHKPLHLSSAPSKKLILKIPNSLKRKSLQSERRVMMNDGLLNVAPRIGLVFNVNGLPVNTKNKINYDYFKTTTKSFDYRTFPEREKAYPFSWDHIVARNHSLNQPNILERVDNPHEILISAHRDALILWKFRELKFTGNLMSRIVDIDRNQIVSHQPIQTTNQKSHHSNNQPLEDDYFLFEVKLMCLEFHEEKKWKKTLAKKIAQVLFA